MLLEVVFLCVFSLLWKSCLCTFFYQMSESQTGRALMHINQNVRVGATLH